MDKASEPGQLLKNPFSRFRYRRCKKPWAGSYARTISPISILGWEDCERLYTALYVYHQKNRIQPVATADTVRPNLSFVSLADGVQVSRAAPPYEEGTFLPRNGEFRVPVEDIKRTLLFADAVVIEDPVFSFAAGSCAPGIWSRYHPTTFLRKVCGNWRSCVPFLKNVSCASPLTSRILSDFACGHSL